MRFAAIILFLLVLATPFGLHKMLDHAPAPGRHQNVASERLIIVTPHNADIRNEYAHAFSAWHRSHYGTDVTLDYRVPGGTSDVKRQLETTYRKKPRDEQGRVIGDVQADISVAWGGGDFFFDQEVKPLGILLPIHMPPALLEQFRAAFPQPTLAGVKLYESTKAADGTPTPQWIGACLSSFGICYNPDVYHALGIATPSAEHGWSDLTDPRLAGLIVLADPAHSGSSAVAYQMVIQHRMDEAEKALFARKPALKSLPKADLGKNPEYRSAISQGWKAGMAELLKIAANTRYFTDSSTLVPMDVSRGEAAAGMAIDFYAKVTEEIVGSDRMRFLTPIGATAITPDPLAILYGTKGRNLELAEHFIEFMLSPEGQRLWILKVGQPGGPIDRSLRRMPIRRDVYTDRTGWADDINPFTAANNFNQRGEWMAIFSDSRPIWVAAWIDSRDSLQKAYRKILSVSDSTRRSGLLDELANLPIEMSDIEQLRNERKRLEQSHGELDQWRAREQIDWSRKFRDHYRDVADHAE